jgi:hypothetical protein
MGLMRNLAKRRNRSRTDRRPRNRFQMRANTTSTIAAEVAIIARKIDAHKNYDAKSASPLLSFPLPGAWPEPLPRHALKPTLVTLRS